MKNKRNPKTKDKTPNKLRQKIISTIHHFYAKKAFKDQVQLQRTVPENIYVVHSNLNLVTNGAWRAALFLNFALVMFGAALASLILFLTSFSLISTIMVIVTFVSYIFSSLYGRHFPNTTDGWIEVDMQLEFDIIEDVQAWGLKNGVNIDFTLASAIASRTLAEPVNEVPNTQGNGTSILVAQPVKQGSVMFAIMENVNTQS